MLCISVNDAIAAKNEDKMTSLLLSVWEKNTRYQDRHLVMSQIGLKSKNRGQAWRHGDGWLNGWIDGKKEIDQSRQMINPWIKG